MIVAFPTKRLLYIRKHSSKKPFKTEMASIANVDSLPPEVMFKIFSYLDIKSTCVASQVCKKWNEIYNTEEFWRKKCAVLDRNVSLERQKGLLWREIFIDHYRIMKTWFSGKFRLVKSPDELPKHFLGPHSAETWGSILEGVERPCWWPPLQSTTDAPSD